MMTEDELKELNRLLRAYVAPTYNGMNGAVCYEDRVEVPVKTGVFEWGPEGDRHIDAVLPTQPQWSKVMAVATLLNLSVQWKSTGAGGWGILIFGP